jgi:GNAT superfamily N-acetyltransferase
MKTSHRVFASTRKKILPATVTIRPLNRSMETARTLAQIQRQVYPKKMRENPRTIYSILASTGLSRGIFMGRELIGYALFQRDNLDNTVYLYDIAVLPRFQHKGLGTRLAQESLASAWQRGLNVRMHVRSTSYPLFVNRNKIRAGGYRLAGKKFVPDFYFGEFGIHEDAHELILRPLAHEPLVAARTAG